MVHSSFHLATMFCTHDVTPTPSNKLPRLRITTQALLEAGIPKETIVEWSKDPKVEVDGESTGFFDCMEDLNVKVRMPLY